VSTYTKVVEGDNVVIQFNDQTVPLDKVVDELNRFYEVSNVIDDVNAHVEQACAFSRDDDDISEVYHALIAIDKLCYPPLK